MPNPHRALALATMAATKATLPFDFLQKNAIASPVPVVPGSLGGPARVFFPSAFLRMPCDLMVVWTIADFPDDRICSRYYDPGSPWYQVFYGAYGIRSTKPGGAHWGYRSNGQPDYDEIFEIPKKDYNDLTAGQLGCPPAKRCFEIQSSTPLPTRGRWNGAEVQCRIPSGIHHALGDAEEVKRFEAWLTAAGSVSAGWLNPAYYLVFGVPDPAMVPRNHPEYEPVVMRGQLYFRPVTEVRHEPITLVWGACCPDTSAGNELLRRIMDDLAARYPP